MTGVQTCALPILSLMINDIEFFDLIEVSTKLKVCVETVRRYIKSGRLKAKKIGHPYYVSTGNLKRFCEDDT